LIKGLNWLRRGSGWGLLSEHFTEPWASTEDAKFLDKVSEAPCFVELEVRILLGVRKHVSFAGRLTEDCFRLLCCWEAEEELYEGVSKVSGLAIWSVNCEWYSSLPLGEVSLFCKSVE
jgi:hypothetical protein